MRFPYYLRRRSDLGELVIESRIVILEFEVNRKGVIESERVKVLDIEVPVWLKWFDDEYGINGQAYYIRASKININNQNTDDGNY